MPPSLWNSTGALLSSPLLFLSLSPHDAFVHLILSVRPPPPPPPLRAPPLREEVICHSLTSPCQMIDNSVTVLFFVFVVVVTYLWPRGTSTTTTTTTTCCDLDSDASRTKKCWNPLSETAWWCFGRLSSFIHWLRLPGAWLGACPALLRSRTPSFVCYCAKLRGASLFTLLELASTLHQPTVGTSWPSLQSHGEGQEPFQALSVGLCFLWSQQVVFCALCCLCWQELLKHCYPLAQFCFTFKPFFSA